MGTTAKIVAAAVGGYLLGRKKKLKMAIGLGLYFGAKKLDIKPQQFVQGLVKDVSSLPGVSELKDQSKEQLLDAGKSAAGDLLGKWAGDLAESLNSKAEDLRSDNGGEEAEKNGAASDTTAEEDEQTGRAEEESDTASEEEPERDEETNGTEESEKEPDTASEEDAKGSGTRKRSRGTASGSDKSASGTGKRSSGTAKRGGGKGGRTTRRKSEGDEGERD
ncbi:hypothetical protein [Nocardiopsis sp. ATB16-24]|uniref:hypothetical protein n=1 Tax=Nocardiopsis sp. ATB16-24 TaxID=3019555 RepID=UPI0025553F05|nr:hypothetical protein [Nocardiopsis sp. ATB16-24]